MRIITEINRTHPLLGLASLHINIEIKKKKLSAIKQKKITALI